MERKMVKRLRYALQLPRFSPKATGLLPFVTPTLILSMDSFSTTSSSISVDNVTASVPIDFENGPDGWYYCLVA